MKNSCDRPCFRGNHRQSTNMLVAASVAVVLMLFVTNSHISAEREQASRAWGTSVMRILRAEAFSTPAVARADEGFCGRFLSFTAPRCARIDTVNTIELGKYTGRWYEIGSTARGKFQPYLELGLACITANYTAAGKTAIGQNAVKVLNRGLVSTAPERKGQVLAISNGVGKVEDTLREICSSVSGQTDPVDEGPHSFNPFSGPPLLSLPKFLSQIGELAETLPSGAQAKVKSAIEDVSESVDRISVQSGRIFRELGGIQERGGVLSQVNAKPGIVLKRKAGILSSVQKIERSAKRILSIRTTIVAAVQELEAAGGKLVAPAIAELQPTLKSLLSSSSSVIALAANVSRIASSIFINKSFQPSPTAAVGRAVQNRQEAGKLVVYFFNQPGNYWVVRLDGAAKNGYDLAVVYSCDYNPFIPPAFVTKPTIFLLSRTPSIPASVLKDVVAELAEKGIILAGDNPLIRTIQKSSVCAEYRKTL